MRNLNKFIRLNILVLMILNVNNSNVNASCHVQEYLVGFGDQWCDGYGYLNQTGSAQFCDFHAEIGVAGTACWRSPFTEYSVGQDNSNVVVNQSSCSLSGNWKGTFVRTAAGIQVANYSVDRHFYASTHYCCNCGTY